MSLLDQLESVESGSKSSGFNPNSYFSIRYVDEEDVFIIFVTDMKRSLKIVRHYDKPKKQYRTCKKTYGKNVECGDCENSDKGISRTSPSRYFLVFNLNVFFNPIGKKDDGTEYRKNPFQIYRATQGEGGENFSMIEDMNGEDPMFYYDDPKNPQKVNPELLKENALFFSETGQDKVWRIKRTGGKDPHTGKETKMSYPPIAQVEHRDVRKSLKLEKDALIAVPKELRALADKLTLLDLAPHYLSQVSDIDWVPFELEPPKEGSRIGDPPKEDAKSDREAAGAKL